MLGSKEKVLNYNPDSKKIISLFMSVQFLGFFFFNGFRVIFPLILEKMGYTELEVYANWAIIFGFGLFISSLTRYPLGIIADKLSRKITLTLSVFFVGISIIIIGLSDNIFILAFFFGVMRTGTHLPPIITRGFINETEKSKQGTINGYGSFVSNIGGMIGPILFEYFLHLSLATLVILSNVILFAFYIFYMLKLPAKKTINTIPINVFIKTSFVELMKFKQVIVLYIILGTINGIINYLQFPYAYYILDLSGSYSSFLIGIITLFSTLFILYAGKLTDQIGVQHTIYLGLVVIILGSIVQILDQSSVLDYFICQLLINGGLLLGQNALVTHITLYSKNSTTSSIFGGTTSFYFFGSSLLPLVNVFIPGSSNLLYSQDPLLPFFLIIFISGIIFPIAFIVGRKKQSPKIAFV